MKLNLLVIPFLLLGNVYGFTVTAEKDSATRNEIKLNTHSLKVSHVAGKSNGIKAPLETMSLFSTPLSLNNLEKSAPIPANAAVDNGPVRSPQMYNGIKVYGSEVIYHYRNGRVNHVSGRISKFDDINTKPRISSNEALSIVKQLKPQFKAASNELKVFPATDKAFLVWHIIENSFSSRFEYFIDADSGEILQSFNALNHIHGKNGKKTKKKSTGKEVVGVDYLGRELNVTQMGEGVYVMKTSANGHAYQTLDMSDFPYDPYQAEAYLPGKEFKQNENVWNEKDSADAHFYTGAFLKVLMDKFNRNSFNGKGAEVSSSVHFSTNYVNAFWNGTQMVYGDGDGEMASPLTGSLDVISHEITHGITQYTSGLTYQNESGALNESFSDIMATYAEYLVQPDQFDWMLGEDVWTPDQDGDALRYMDNPTKDKERIPEDEDLPAYYKEYYSRDYYPEKFNLPLHDNGGVHFNSGISNLAFYLLSSGGAHPRGKTPITVQGIGIDKAAMIFYKAFTEYLSSSSEFSDAKAATIKVASELYGPNEAKSVEDAWNTVGVN
ncbi:MAG: peptidase M4 family protein [Halobacteriovoraceae bacterium]|nr:peptidase M4 family protein [Halobacteriovoraceae bacterium]MCB9095750.1 peptidase M4 family protein [Halobacteriovoraceae bacterium]